MGGERTFIQGKMEMAGLVGPLWFWGWLFTLGYCHLALPRALWALFVWPFYLGSRLAG